MICATLTNIQTDRHANRQIVFDQLKLYEKLSQLS